MSVAMKINEELNGIELYFENKPEQNILHNLKSNGFRWSGFKKCWYTKQTDKAFQIAADLTNNKETSVTPSKKSATISQSKIHLSLWEATRWTDINVNKNQDVKEIAKDIRTHIRKRFPQCKFSVRVPYYGHISFDIKSSPFEKDSMYLNEIKGYCTNLLDAYNHCYSPADPYTDYPGRYNFTGWVSVDYEYKQTEMTQEIEKDIQEFNAKFEEYQKAQEARKKQEFLEYEEQQKAREEEYKKRLEEEKKQTENIYNRIDIVELNENNQYYIVGAEFANLNKNNTLDEYKEEVSKGDFTKQDVKVTKEIHFNSKDALIHFSDMLLSNFDFLANTGGSYTDDNRINSMTDYYSMSKEDAETVKWNLYGVAVYFDNKLQFVIDAQGYSYARYVGLTDNAQIEKTITDEQILSGEELEELQMQAEKLEDISTSVIEELDIMSTWEKEEWKIYKDEFKKKLNEIELKLSKDIIQQIDIEPLKVAMYKILQEVDSIQEQFKKADITEGEKLTLFYISDWGGLVTDRITFDSAKNEKYAQYDNAVKLIFKPENKRKLHYKHFYSTLLVYKGWHSLPETLLDNVEFRNGMRIKSSKYLSCDNRQYDEILNYFEKQGMKPIVNTCKPRF